MVNCCGNAIAGMRIALKISEIMVKPVDHVKI
jgi:hypothetical protein